MDDIRRAGDRQACGLVVAFIEQAKADQYILESLSIDDFGKYGLAAFDVAQWDEGQKGGRNLWRVKLSSLEKLNLPYRIVYAFNAKRRQYVILGVINRGIAYSIEHPRIRKLIAVYDRLIG